MFVKVVDITFICIPNLSDKIKCNFFQVVVASVLLYAPHGL